MKRQEKYPETSTFHYHNANPKNRITEDCVIRAISVACEIPYNQVVMDLAKIQCETGYDCGGKGISILMEQYGWIKMRQPRKIFSNTKYTGEEFCNELQKGTTWSEHDYSRIVANIGSHHIVAIINGKVWDIWNSTNGCIGNYWVKNN